ncbi:MAG: cytochrome c peroxidase [Planctomycetaceae bacterium]
MNCKCWLMMIGIQVVVQTTVLAGDVTTPHWRRPVALVITDEGRHLITANQQSGSLSLLDARRMRVQSETSIGKRLSDLVVSPVDNNLLLTTDEESHELLAVRRQDEKFAVIKRLDLSPYPVTIRMTADGSRACIASLWSRTISVVDVALWLESKTPDSSVVTAVRLPFAPRELLMIDEAHKLIVADAFGSKLAVVKLAEGSVKQSHLESVREILGHGIRKMSRHPTLPRVVMTHQILSRGARSSLDDVHWGNLMVNCLRSLALDDLLDPKANISRRTQLEFLGGPDRGAGDPAGFVIRPRGGIAIALSGTNELLMDDGSRSFGIRLPTGERPTAVVLGTDEFRTYILNTLSDSITVAGLRDIVGTISLGSHPELTSAERGERLFHSAKLSHEGWFSCASCHTDGHTNGLLNDNFTDGTFDTPKRVLTLRGVADTAPYAWNGRFETLREQIQHSISSTMQGEPLSDQQTDDLETYLRTLSPAPPPPEVNSAEARGLAERGAALFEKLDCARCHRGPTYTSARVVDVDLADERGDSKYNPPSLRGLSQQNSFFHDARATSLEEVFTKYQHQTGTALTAEQVKELVAFLNRL